MSYYSLENYISGPLSRLLVSIFFPTIFIAISSQIITIRKEERNYKNILFYFLTVTSLSASFIFVVSWIFGVSKIFIKSFLLILGLISILEVIRKTKTFLLSLKRYCLLYPLPSIILGLFLLLALAPATDADSLAYHLGIPLNFLNKGYIEYIPFMNHMMLYAMPETFNLIGLSIGTDCLSAVTQIFALSLLVFSIEESFHKSDKTSKNLLLLTLVTPFFLIFLGSSQKAQLLGTFSLVLALLFYKSNKADYKKPLALIFIAFSFKLSFYISGGLFLLFMFYFSNKKTFYLFHCLIFYILLIFPLHFFHFLNTGSPIPPFLSFLMEGEGLSNISTLFHEHLRSYKEGYGLPLGLIFPKGAGNITTVFGLIFIIPLILFFSRFKFSNSPKRELILFFVILVCSILLAQNTSRFFYFQYIFLVLLAFWTSPTRQNISLRVLASAQGIAVIAILLFSNYLLLGGAISKKLRNRTLINNAYLFEQFLWVNKTLPKDALVINTFRPKVYLKRKSISNDYYLYTKYSPRKLYNFFNQLPHDYIYFISPKKNHEEDILIGNLGSITIFAENEFPIKTRNPFNDSDGKRKVYILKISKSELVKELNKRI